MTVKARVLAPDRETRRLLEALSEMGEPGWGDGVHVLSAEDDGPSPNHIGDADIMIIAIDLTKEGEMAGGRAGNGDPSYSRPAERLILEAKGLNPSLKVIALVDVSMCEREGGLSGASLRERLTVAESVMVKPVSARRLLREIEMLCGAGPAG